MKYTAKGLSSGWTAQKRVQDVTKCIIYIPGHENHASIYYKINPTETLENLLKIRIKFKLMTHQNRKKGLALERFLFVEIRFDPDSRLWLFSRCSIILRNVVAFHWQVSAALLSSSNLLFKVTRQPNNQLITCLIPGKMIFSESW